MSDDKDSDEGQDPRAASSRPGGSGGGGDGGPSRPTQPPKPPEGGDGTVISLADARDSGAHPSQGPSSKPFNWIVNLDAGGDFRGAIEFMRWLEDGLGTHHFYGVHVPPDDTTDGFESESGVRQMLAQDRSTELFTSIMRTESRTRPSVVFSDFDTSLSAVLLLGRKEDPGADEALVHTSGMVRRLVEQTGMPVVIVPSDFRRDKMSTGPVMVAVDPEDTSSEVAHFAQRLADCQRLSLLLVHVARADTPSTQRTIDEIQADYEKAEKAATESVQQWAQRSGVPRAKRDVVRGDLRHGVQRTAGRHDASILVCGTNASETAQRLEHPSEVFELARYSHRPMALVPRGAKLNGDEV